MITTAAATEEGREDTEEFASVQNNVALKSVPNLDEEFCYTCLYVPNPMNVRVLDVCDFCEKVFCQNCFMAGKDVVACSSCRAHIVKQVVFHKG